MSSSPVRRPLIVLDGGMGRELQRIGAPFRQPEWSAQALIQGPDWVVRAHRNFIDAGATVITTNSYALVPFHIGEDRFGTDGLRFASLAGQLAREAASAGRTAVRVAGSLPPLFGSYRPDLFDAVDAPRIIDPLVAGLAPFVDLWLGETLSSIAEVHAISDALRRSANQPKPLWISYTLDDRDVGILRSGESVADAVEAAIDLGAAAILFNCSQPESISEAIIIANGVSGGRALIGGYANRFVATHTSTGEANEQLSGLRADLGPEEYCAIGALWLASGATILGGCCGTTPEHIAALSALCSQHDGTG